MEEAPEALTVLTRASAANAPTLTPTTWICCNDGRARRSFPSCLPTTCESKEARRRLPRQMDQSKTSACRSSPSALSAAITLARSRSVLASGPPAPGKRMNTELSVKLASSGRGCPYTSRGGSRVYASSAKVSEVTNAKELRAKDMAAEGSRDRDTHRGESASERTTPRGRMCWDGAVQMGIGNRIRIAILPLSSLMRPPVQLPRFRY